MKLGLREANQEFSRLVRAVRAGQEVVLTDRGQPIAVVKPLERHAREKAFQVMVTEGLIRPARQRGPMKLSRFRPLKVTGKSLAEAISADREERL
jgi:prevent-host-death family protein